MKIDGTIAKLHEKWFGAKAAAGFFGNEAGGRHTGVPNMAGYDPTPITPKCT